MSIVAIVPVAQLAAVNATLELAGFGPGNFSVPANGKAKTALGKMYEYTDSGAFGWTKR